MMAITVKRLEQIEALKMLEDFQEYEATISVGFGPQFLRGQNANDLEDEGIEQEMMVMIWKW